MNVETVMTPKAVICYGDSSLAEATQLMLEHDCGILPVIESMSHHLVGVITDRDIAIGVMSQGLPAHNIPVRTCCSRDIVTCRPQDDLTMVHEKMRTHRVRRLPVVNEENNVVGVISLDDLALLAFGSEPQEGMEMRYELGRTFAEVCRKQGHMQA